MSRLLNSVEKQWIDKLLSADFKGRDILHEQLNNSEVFVEKDFSFISLRFVTSTDEERFPYNIRVPVEMRAYQSASAPIVFLLHLKDGLVNELEIITADSSKIDINTISVENVNHEINKELL